MISVPNQNYHRVHGPRRNWCYKTFLGRECKGPFPLLYAHCANSNVRKLIANSVLLLTLGVFFVPAFANPALTAVPVCCRRGGAHHCSAVAQVLNKSETSLRARNSCPMWHGPLLVSGITGLPASMSLANVLNRQLLASRPLALSLLANHSSEYQRGPPKLL